LNFLTKVTVARLFGESDYGAVSLGFAVLTTLAILTTAGIDTGIGRFLPRFDDIPKRRGVLVSAYGLIMPVAVLVGIATGLSSEYLAGTLFGDPTVAPVLAVFGVTIPVAVFVRLTIGSVRGMKEAVPRIVIQNVALPVVRLSLIVGVVWIGGDIVAVSWSYTAAYAVAAALSLYYLFARTSLFSGDGVEFMHRRLLLFSVPLMVTTAMSMILSNLDTIILGVFGTTGDVGAYNVVYPLASLLTIALSAFGFVFMPVVSGLDSDGRDEQFELAYQVVTKWIFVLTFPLLLAAVSYPETTISITFGSEYSRAGPALVVLALGFFTHAVSGPSGNALTALGETRIIMLDNVVVAVVNVGLNLLLIPRFSLLGAAVATTASYLLLNGLYVAHLYRFAGVHPFRTSTFVSAGVGLVAWGGVYWVAIAVVDGTGRLFLSVLVFGILYPLLFVLTGGVEEAEIWALEAIEDRFGVELTRVRSVLRTIGQ
jgi:O-antigen/teichoic acid export membrane protein